MTSDQFQDSRSADAPVAFPAKAVRPFPDPRPAGSAVSAVSAVGAAGLADPERGTLMATLRMQVLERSARAARASLSAARPRPQTARWAAT